MATTSVNDGLMIGNIPRHGIVCGICGAITYGVEVKKKREFEPDNKGILLNKADTIGIGCGCYGKVHRQVAHITTKRKSS